MKLCFFFIRNKETRYGNVSRQALQFLHLFVFSSYYHLSLQFKKQLSQLETLLREVMGSEDNNSKPITKKSCTLTRAMIPRKYRTPVSRVMSRIAELVHENWKRIWVFVAWLAINVALFVYKYDEYMHTKAFKIMGYCLCVAKGAAETLKFNMALILLPVCRGTLTRLRSTFLSNLFPFDDNINFHKIISMGITVGTFLHVFMHISCDFPRLISCPKEKFMALVGPNFHYHQPSYVDLVASITGVSGILMLIIMGFAYVLASHKFRRNVIKLPAPLHHLAGFNAFWYSHHLLVFAYVLLIIHGHFLFLTSEWHLKTVCFASRILSFSLSLFGDVLVVLFGFGFHERRMLDYKVLSELSMLYVIGFNFKSN